MSPPICGFSFVMSRARSTRATKAEAPHVTRNAGVSMTLRIALVTQLLIAVSEILQHYLLFVVGAVVVLFFLMNRWYQTESGRLVLDRHVTLEENRPGGTVPAD